MPNKTLAALHEELRRLTARRAEWIRKGHVQPIPGDAYNRTLAGFDKRISQVEAMITAEKL